MVLDLDTNTYHALGGSGALLYRLMRERDHSEDELVQRVVDTYETDEQLVRRDVRRFLVTLADAGLLADPDDAHAC
jgi:hypothetical protein